MSVINTSPEIAVLPPAQSVEQAPSRAVDYYELTKPRMNFLVLVTTMVGFFMAVTHHWDWLRLPATLAGTALAAASAATLNQWIERDYDRLMPRTRNRPFASGRLSSAEVFGFGIVLGVLGVVCLLTLVNATTAVLGLTTILSYLLVYTPLKRVTTLNTVVGAIPGAIPPMMGWTAVTGRISVEAAALFCVLFLWQMPHFLAIAILYKRDYAAGGFKMLPVVDEDLTITGRQMILYAAALIPVSLVPTLLGMTGTAYFVVAVMLGLGYLSFSLTAASTRERLDARKLFFFSIIYLPVLLAAMMMNKR